MGPQWRRVAAPGPTAIQQVKDLTIGVRAASPPQTVSEMIPLDPGKTLVLDKSRFAGLVPHTSELNLALGPIARLNVPMVLDQLDRYPYGCVEQLSSRALPLLYLNDVAVSLGMGTDAALKQRITDAVADILSHQTS